ncbi:sterol carrier family protein [Microlunatus sp. Y2014]|uniref:sterol carrier family protein n=1 Tax=Microlunatus sp. Y2014 TaxID=3418488 RepID=UPI003DA72250
MPPDRRLRTIEAITDSAHRLADWLAAAPIDPDHDSVLPGWPLSTLVAHLGSVVRSVPAALARPTRDKAVPLVRYFDLFSGSGAVVDDRERARYAELGWPGVRDDITVAADELAALVADTDLPDRVAVLGGPLRTTDLVALRLADLVVHADDLSRSVPQQPPVELGRPALTITTKLYADGLAARHPGHSVEVRIPPYAAVQCGVPGEGPTHTRGTPPNVIETDVTTFLRLASGRMGWDEAVSSHAVHASGARADLSGLLPLW